MFFPMWKRATVCLACIGMVAPQVAIASDKVPQSPKRADVSLTAGGTLNGSVVNAVGEAQAGVPVTVRFKGHTIAHATTNKSGRFAVRGLRGGVHEIVTPVSHTTQRLWSAAMAPKSARTAVVVKPGPTIVRGQDDDYYFDYGGALVGGLAVVGTIVGIAAWADSDSSGRSRAPSSP